MNHPPAPDTGAKKTMELSKAAQWLVATQKAPGGVSPLGDKVAQILDRIWGIHNVPFPKVSETKWDDPYVISIVLSHCSLGTVDDNRLTLLVVLCHDEMMRMSISARAGKHLELMFHQRYMRIGAMFERCPRIEDHIKSIRGEQ